MWRRGWDSKPRPPLSRLVPSTVESFHWLGFPSFVRTPVPPPSPAKLRLPWAQFGHTPPATTGPPATPPQILGLYDYPIGLLAIAAMNRLLRLQLLMARILLRRRLRFRCWQRGCGSRPFESGNVEEKRAFSFLVKLCSNPKFRCLPKFIQKGRSSQIDYLLRRRLQFPLEEDNVCASIRRGTGRPLNRILLIKTHEDSAMLTTAKELASLNV